LLFCSPLSQRPQSTGSFTELSRLQLHGVSQLGMTEGIILASLRLKDTGDPDHGRTEDLSPIAKSTVSANCSVLMEHMSVVDGRGVHERCNAVFPS
jgi:hypothetical protein